MLIQFNDQPMECPQDQTLSQLLDQLDQMQPGVALAVNQCIIPRPQWPTTRIQEGDNILLFQVIAGG